MGQKSNFDGAVKIKVEKFLFSIRVLKNVRVINVESRMCSKYERPLIGTHPLALIGFLWRRFFWVNRVLANVLTRGCRLNVSRLFSKKESKESAFVRRSIGTD